MTVVLLTDKYELTMLTAALHDSKANLNTIFEVFARRLPAGRRYGIVSGVGRFIEALAEFKFTNYILKKLSKFLDSTTLDFLSSYQFHGDIEGYAEGELYFPGSPILTVSGKFAECILLETLVLSILNHDTAVASAAARIISAAQGKPVVEMGSRRTHELAAVSAARAAYIAGFAGSSNLAAQYQYNIPAIGTAGHSYMLLYTNEFGPNEVSAFRNQIAVLNINTTLLVDTYNITSGITNAVTVAGPKLGGVRIDSGNLSKLSRQVRYQLDKLGATNTKISVSGDLNEFTIASLCFEPIDSYGVGTSVVTGSGLPTAEMVYKLVEVNGKHVTKLSDNKKSYGGHKQAIRLAKISGTLVEEIIYSYGNKPLHKSKHKTCYLTVPLVIDGLPVKGHHPAKDISMARKRVIVGLKNLPLKGLRLSYGEPAIPTRIL